MTNQKAVHHLKVACLYITAILMLAEAGPSLADVKRIRNINSRVFNCARRNNSNSKGYVKYYSDGRLKVGNHSGWSAYMRYEYDGNTLKLISNGGWDPNDVLGKTRDGILRTAQLCQAGQLR